MWPKIEIRFTRVNIRRREISLFEIECYSTGPDTIRWIINYNIKIQHTKIATNEI